MLLGDILDELGDEVARTLGAGAAYRRLDVTREPDWQQAVAFADQQFGLLDVLVNNAAVLHFAPIARTTLDDWNRVIAVNQTGPLLPRSTEFRDALIADLRN